MTVLVGNFGLSLGFLVTAGALLAAIAAAKFESESLLRLAKVMIGAFAALVTIASAALLVALLGDEFGVSYVASYSERAMPVGYKLAAFWAGQEGSLLLWAWMIAIMGALALLPQRSQTISESAATVGTLAVVCGFFAALMLFAANPFAVSGHPPVDGRGLNPMLQDPAMIAHPPLLFLGYAGYTIPFAFMVGALVAGRRDAEWLSGMRRWNIASWLFLSVGILLGAQWAYVELGWGGYWAWDPVENASLLPWLTGTAVLHSVMVQQQRGMFKIWNVSLVATTFVLCLFGTYLTRSGVIQSVHAFGESAIGTFFLSLIILIILVSVLLIVWRRKALRGEHALENLANREGAFLATNILLVGIMLVTLFGTISPIFFRMFGSERAAQPEFYNQYVAPMGLLLVALMAVGPLLTYGADAASRLLRRLVLPAVAAAAVGAWLLISGVQNVWALLGGLVVALTGFAIAADLVRSLIGRVRTNHENPLVALIKLLDGNHRRYGGQVVHVGVAMIVAGVIGSSLFGADEMFQVKPGQTVEIGGNKITYNELRDVRHANFTAVQADLTLVEPDGQTSQLTPQKRFYDKFEQPNTEVAIRSTMKQDLYVTLAGWEAGGSIAAIEVLVNPLVSWIWTGGLVMTIGGFVCLIPRLIPVPASAAEPVVPVGAEPRRNKGKQNRRPTTVAASA